MGQETGHMTKLALLGGDPVIAEPLPPYQSMGEAGKIFVLQFFMVYFLYLFLETLFVLKLFNSK